MLVNFDMHVKFECQRALALCAQHQEFDIEKEYTLPEILTMLKNEKSESTYFMGFSGAIDKGMNGVTEITLLSFDQSDFGSNLHDLFLVLRTNLQAISRISEIADSKETLKFMVISCLDIINDINVARNKKTTYSILDSDKKYIKSIITAVTRNKSDCD